MEISTSVAVMQCLLAIGDKKESKETKTIGHLDSPIDLSRLILPQRQD